MKKLVIAVAIVTLSLSFIACGGKSESKADEKATTEDIKVETEEEKVETKPLDKYEALFTKYIEVLQKAKTGDADALQEVQKLTEEMAPLAQQLAQEAASMTPEQQQKFQELAQKLLEATQN